MRFMKRTNGEQLRQPADSGDGGESDAVNQARSQADRMLAAGDEAIRRAVTGGNSEAFLRSAMQQGGE